MALLRPPLASVINLSCSPVCPTKYFSCPQRRHFNQNYFEGRRYFSNVDTAPPVSSVTKPPPMSLVKGGWAPERFRTVPFVKENLRSVIEEVPDVQYYYIGDPDPQGYPYREIPVDQPIDYEVNLT